MMQLFVMALDTLPDAGRIFLFAFLLSLALYALSFTRVANQSFLLFCKGTVFALFFLPVLMLLLNVRMPVYMDEVTRFATQVPFWTTWGLFLVWAVGVMVGLWRLQRRFLLTGERQSRLLEQDRYLAPEKVQRRAKHWARRLDVEGELRVVCDGAEWPWHLQPGFKRTYVIVLPAASANWPMPVIDAICALQLAQFRQGVQYWWFFANFMAVMYWMFPWVDRIVKRMPDHFAQPAISLASAAYRDPEGWRKDLRQAQSRLQGFDELEDLSWVITTPASLEQPAQEAPAEPQTVQVDDFEVKRVLTKDRWKARHYDPLERTYWLIALSAVFAGVMTTLTIVKTPPEFEPRFFEIKWQDRMARRLPDYFEQVPSEGGGDNAGAAGASDSAPAAPGSSE